MITALNVIGYLALAYCYLVMISAEARGNTWSARVVYLVTNFKWQFWAIFMAATLAISLE